MNTENQQQPADPSVARVIELQAENIMGVRAVSLTFDKHLIVIGGDNRQGKTSVLRCIEMLFRGPKSFGDLPVREGAEQGWIKGELIHPEYERLRIKRTITADGKQKLIVRDIRDNNVRSPQALLTGLFGPLSFDPCTFRNASPADQLEMVKQVVGIDTAAIDKRIEDLYEERRAARQDVTRQQAVVRSMDVPTDAPAKEISVSELVAALQQAEEHNRAIGARAAETEKQADLVARRANEVLEAEEAIKKWQAVLGERKNDLADARAKLSTMHEAAKQQKLIDTSELRDRLANAEFANEAARKARAYRIERDRFTEYEKAFDALEVKLADARKAKEKQIAEAKFPVAGMGLHDEKGVLLNGRPLSAASDEEALVASYKMGLAMNPGCRLVLINQGSELDSKNLALLESLAREDYAYVVVVRVSRGAECHILMEDGVASMAKEAEENGESEPV